MKTTSLECRCNTQNSKAIAEFNPVSDPVRLRRRKLTQAS